MKHAFSIADIDPGKTKRLKTSFESNFYLYRQIRREGQIAIYSRSKFKLSTYEVMIIAILQDQKKGVFLASYHELRSTQSGLGWRYPDLKNAEVKFQKLKKYLSLVNPTQKEVFELFILK